MEDKGSRIWKIAESFQEVNLKSKEKRVPKIFYHFFYSPHQRPEDFKKRKKVCF